MIRKTTAFLATIVMLILLIACAGSGGAPPASPVSVTDTAAAQLTVDKATNIVALLSSEYKVGRQTAYQLRAMKPPRLNDDQWVRVVKAENEVLRVRPLILESLNTWTATGQKPLNYEFLFQQFASAIANFKMAAGTV
jgi:hypothetical protein